MREKQTAGFANGKEKLNKHQTDNGQKKNFTVQLDFLYISEQNKKKIQTQEDQGKTRSKKWNEMK